MCMDVAAAGRSAAKISFAEMTGVPGGPDVRHLGLFSLTQAPRI
jgi:hypothetical protein